MYFKIKAKKLLCAEQELGVQGLGDYKSLILTETMSPHRITFSCARSLISKTEKTPNLLSQMVTKPYVKLP